MRWNDTSPAISELARSDAIISVRALMKCTSFVLLCALMLFGVACEKHPLPGEPAPRMDRASSDAGPAAKREEHSGGKTPVPGEGRDDGAQPAAKRPEAEEGKTAEPPKFFPEKK